MTQIKICGLKTIEDVNAVNEFNPDYIGFIFVSDRKRYIEPDKAYELKKALNPSIKAVGVFINEEIDKVVEISERGIVDVIQLHGTEDNDYISELRRRANKPIFKAIRVDSSEDIKIASACLADTVLFDCGIGGTGKTFDWSLLSEFNKPFFLAGGLTCDNVSEALKLSPMGLDVSSGVETDGKKDKEKIKRFISLVRKEDLKND